MKHIITLIIIAMVFSSCGPGRWVGGNKKHFEDRARIKAEKKSRALNDYMVHK
jgi:hypothetical protein